MTMTDQPVGAFLDALAAKRPVPGGGAVASLVAALGAALGRMVVAYSAGKPALAEHAALHAEAAADLEHLQRRAAELADADARAYDRLNRLMKLDRESAERRAAWEPAVRAAIDAPRGVLAACLALLERLETLTGRTNRMLGSDLAIAAVLAEAAARAAAWNVRINLPLLDDEAARVALGTAVAAEIGRAAASCRAIEERLA
ncbi:MAG: cyclodeaminase/cyclohydrolase family protein [Planctomycetota bacterium]|jgi:formiminotetrahydrofolate cyclodeaminase